MTEHTNKQTQIEQLQEENLIRIIESLKDELILLQEKFDALKGKDKRQIKEIAELLEENEKLKIEKESLKAQIEAIKNESISHLI